MQMKNSVMNCRLTIVIAASFASLFVADRTIFAEEAIRFGRDILPILSANCFACHGPDDSVRKANLRLDVEADAKANHDSGVPIVPGMIDQSTLVQRIASSDPELIMPPPDSHKVLKSNQIELLRRWIAEGGQWGRHWSFESLQRPERQTDPEQSAIDAFVIDTLKKKGLMFRPAASPHQLARRLALDLTGVPPSLEVANSFAENSNDDAYEKMVDDLLASSRFGEHWARVWMDLARYADTKGYEKDLGRTMWPYRDWLIEAINADMPLDRMTVEQLAGDLLPDASPGQLVATAFHRNTMSNDEGGTDDEEFRTIAVKDRVDTTLQVWMGLTAGCAKCHSHKYDPISQAEYYSLYAIFNQTQDADRYDDAPTLDIPSEGLEKERVVIRNRVSSLKSQISKSEADAAATENARWQFNSSVSARSENDATLTAQEDSSILAEGTSPADDVYIVTITLQPGKYTVLRVEALTEKNPDGQLGVGRNSRDPNFVLSELEVELLSEDESVRLKLANPRADYSQEGWPVANAVDGDTKTGWAVSPRQREQHGALFNFESALQLETESKLRVTMRQHYGDSLTLRRFRLSTCGEEADLVELLQPTAESRRLNDDLAAANKELQELQSRVPRVPVLRAVDPDKQRTTRIHRRGNFLDPGEEVTAGLPSSFQGPPTGVASDRLALATWLMSRENPLTARVWANRIWARLFGIGIVETEEDFGSLGSLPTHPELLDWLAVEYCDNGWSLKKLLKTILMSRTYRQASEVTDDVRALDPRNTLLSRGARFRLSAEIVRDQSLAVAGLLSRKMSGPPVMPPQPDGLWRSTYNGQKWVNAEGEDRFRRAIYTYLKRTTPYPSMTTFDGGSGEVCQIRRIRTNTPLQALVTLNDPVYLEAAGALATRIVALPGDAPSRASYGLRLALIRPIRDGEITPLVTLQQDASVDFRKSSGQAAALIKATRTTLPKGMTEAEFSGWIVVANTILNLDEFLSRN